VSDGDPISMKTIYRLSDKGNIKHKLSHATKLHCLENYISIFGKQDLILFADNCEHETISAIRKLGIQPVEISLGNAGSWRHAAEYAISNFEDEDAVYLLEDDYLHLPGARQVLLEGIQIADYVSLYDHPDKYINHEDGGPNPHIKSGGELSRVLISASSHWKTTNSTTMTFAVKVKTLREDYAIWKRHVINLPLDFPAFSVLQKNPVSPKGKLFSLLGIQQPVRPRVVISSLPAKATHVESNWLAPLIEWTNV
jgi:hypothetical protein